MTMRVASLDDVAATVLRPDDAGYDEARRTFNGMIDRRPAAIVACRSTADVVAAVRAARAGGLPIAVRGGGHGVAGHAMADGAVAIDLRQMRSVEVDAARRVARVAGGALWEDVDAATVPHGLATTGGTFGDTGVGGLTLTGGIGFLMGTAGLTCDNLVGAEVVTADGSVVQAGESGDGGEGGESGHPELLWALRGGGGNFGVVTEFTFALHPLGPIQLGAIVVPVEYAGAALAAAAELASQAPPELVVFVVGPTVNARDGAPLDPTAEPVLRIALVYQGEPDSAEAVIHPLRSLPGARGGFVAASYAEAQAVSGVIPFALRHYWKGHFVRELDGPAIDAVVTGLATAPGGMSFMLLEAITGQARSEPAGGAAFGQRDAHWNVTALAIWQDPAEDARQIGWARQTADALRRSSLTGAGYGNYAPVDETAERVRAAFGVERFARLAAVKRRYDPDNVFRFNHNIPPASESG